MWNVFKIFFFFFLVPLICFPQDKKVSQTSFQIISNITLPENYQKTLNQMTLFWFKNFTNISISEDPSAYETEIKLSKRPYNFEVSVTLKTQNRTISQEYQTMKKLSEFPITIHQILSKIFSNQLKPETFPLLFTKQDQDISIMFLMENSSFVNTDIAAFNENPFSIFSFLLYFTQNQRIRLGYANFRDRELGYKQIFVQPNLNFAYFLKGLNATPTNHTNEESRFDVGLDLLLKKTNWKTKKRYVFAFIGSGFVKKNETVQKILALKQQGVKLFLFTSQGVKEEDREELQKFSKELGFPLIPITYKMNYLNSRNNLSSLILKNGNLFKEAKKNHLELVRTSHYIKSIDDIPKELDSLGYRLKERLTLQLNIELPDSLSEVISPKKLKKALITDATGNHYSLYVSSEKMIQYLSQNKGKEMTLGGFIQPFNDGFMLSLGSVHVDSMKVPQFFIQPLYKLEGKPIYYGHSGFFVPGLWYFKAIFIRWESQ